MSKTYKVIWEHEFDLYMASGWAFEAVYVKTPPSNMGDSITANGRMYYAYVPYGDEVHFVVSRDDMNERVQLMAQLSEARAELDKLEKIAQAFAKQVADALDNSLPYMRTHSK